MAYELIIDNDNKKIEIHYDLCDVLFEIKDNYHLNNEVEYISLMSFDEVDEFLLKDDFNEFDIVYCEKCAPKENREKYDEEYDDFYEEFDEDEEYGGDSCDIF